ncbi:MAG: dockerin type I repeat-containing protein, partial [Ruminococcus sp.]|nr:dockerin type I repeat-containing protein [Ruminococcus sp.]
NNVSAVMTTANELIAQGEGVADEALVESTLESLVNAKSALVLTSAGLSYAVKGKTAIVGVAVQDADITVTVNGKSYKTHSNEITGEFTVEATALTASSVIKVDVERKGLSSKTYSYNMSNGDITSYIPPTTTPPETQPTTTPPETQPTTPPAKLGDVTGDGSITIKDATLVQKYIASLASLTSQQIQVADVNNDGDINIKDVTEIQKHVAGISSALG